MDMENELLRTDRKWWLPVLFRIVLGFVVVLMFWDTIFSLVMGAIKLGSLMGGRYGYGGLGSNGSSLASIMLTIFKILIVVGILAYIVYMIIFYINAVKDMNTVCAAVDGDSSKDSPHYLIAVIFSVLTMGIYEKYWFYKHGNRMRKAADAYGVTMHADGEYFLLISLLGLLFPIGPFRQVNMAIMIHDLNLLCEKYNENPMPMQAADQNFAPAEDGQDRTVDHVSAPVQASAAAIGIRGVRGEYAGATIPMEPDREVKIGRNANMVNIVINSEKVSHVHCGVTYSSRDNCYYVTDYSRNGVFLENGSRIAASVPVRCERGTVISLSSGENAFTLV